MIVNIHSNPIKATGRLINWIVKAREWSFPPQPPKPGEIYFEREYTFEELEKRRYYLYLDAMPYHVYLACQKYKDVNLDEPPYYKQIKEDICLFVHRISVLFEIINGKLVTPELESWKEHIIKSTWTDSTRFYKMRDATKDETDMFLHVLGYDLTVT